MPRYYYLNFNDIASNNKPDNDAENKILVIDYISVISFSLLVSGISIFLRKALSKDQEKTIDLGDLCLFILLCIYLLRSIFINNRYRLCSFKQAYIKNSDYKAIESAYYILQNEHPDLLAEFIKFKNLATCKDFINYYLQISTKGLCTGYTHEVLRQIALYPAKKPTRLLAEIKTAEIIKHQLIEHIKCELVKRYSPGGDTHLCFSACPCRKIEPLENKIENFPRVAAVNTLFAGMEGQGVFKAGMLNQFFTRHLQSRGFVPPKKLNNYWGNDPISDLQDKDFMTAELKLEEKEISKKSEFQQLSVNRMLFSIKRDRVIRQRKLEYIEKRSEIINFDKFTVAGHISIKGTKDGHAMLYKFSKQHILFFDCNYGLYQYPSSEVFSQQLARHLSNNYGDTKSISLKTMLFLIK